MGREFAAAGRQIIYQLQVSASLAEQIRIAAPAYAGSRPECRGSTRNQYLRTELNEHLPNQLSGHKEHSMLLTTSDIKDVDPELVNAVCAKHDTILVALDIGAADVENAIREIST